MSRLGPIDVALYLSAGAAVGSIYFLLLLRSVRLLASQADAARIVPLFVIRLGAAVSAFWVVAQQGAAALLLTLAGFLIARGAINSRIRGL